MQPKSAQTFGQTVEVEAAAYLRQKGYRILNRNLRLATGELDLVAEQGKHLGVYRSQGASF